MRSLCEPISVGDSVSSLSETVSLASVSQTLSWDTFARMRPDRFSITSTMLKREPYLQVREKAKDLASSDCAAGSLTNRMLSGPGTCVRIRTAEDPTVRTGQVAWSITDSATDPNSVFLHPVRPWVPKI